MTRGRPYILWYATGLHILWGSAVLIDPAMTGLVIFVGLNKLAVLGSVFLGLLLLSTAILAGGALLLESRIGRFRAFMCVMPQYMLLLLALVTDIEIFIRGVNPLNDRETSRVVIAAILGPVALSAILHTLGVLERYVPKWRL